MTGLLAACSSKPSRYALKHDGYPTNPPNLGSVEDAYPHVEPLSRGGNKNYTVNGQRYKVWKGIKKYNQVGYASWYGKKFQGHHTSNGEIYDMYSMSAAHKSLPLPSYVRVTNLSNHKSVIVRVNDRGPFHSKRIIDLSYAAAYKLGMLHHGTAKVRVVLINPRQPTKAALHSPPNTKKKVALSVQVDKFYVQLLAFRDKSAAMQHQKQLTQQGYRAQIVQSKAWTKLRIGPFKTRQLAEQAKAKMRQQEYKDAFIVN